MGKCSGWLACGVCLWAFASGVLHLQAVPARGSLPSAASPQRPIATQATPAPTERLLLDRYCTSCHNSRLRTANLALDNLDPANVRGTEHIWEKVAAKLRNGAMPPPGRPRPDPTAARTFVTQIESALDENWRAAPNPGRTAPLHRLNRSEYANAVRDLLAIEVDTRELLPVDDSNHGFDSMATVLTVSPVLLERYLSAARRVSRLAVGDPTIGPGLVSRTYETNLFQDDQMSDDLPFGSRGGLAIRHYFPLTGEYVVRIALQKNYVNYVRGLNEPHQLHVRLDGTLVEEFTIGGGAPGAPAPTSYGGNISGSAEWEAYALSADQGLEVRFRAEAGPRVVGVSFVRRPGEPEGVLQPPQTGYAFAVDETRSSPDGLGGPAVDTVAIDGPYNPEGPGDTPSRRKIFTCRPASRADEAGCARRILRTLTERAFRRPATSQDVDALLTFYEAGRAAAGFEAGIQKALERVLVDPEFVFRIERDPRTATNGAAYRISDSELASRLSFFLWSSIPDDELLRVAAEGKLQQPATLERQVRRMLADRRSRALVDNFARQWLTLRNLDAAAPNPDVYPEFDENLRDAFRRETELFVASHLRADRSVVDLLNAEETFLNERLARHYGIPNVYGNHFRPVPVARGKRTGLLGHGSILTVTSYSNRTSPVLRGHWLLENILGTPPPPPPPDVPGLAERGEDGTRRSVRERLEQHRRNPSCATCHVVMDPLGFALEEFDGIGKVRQFGEGGAPVDASGALPDGTTFQGLGGLRDHLLTERDQFVRTVVEKLLMYALGRGLEYYDRPVIRAISRESASANYRWSSIILGVVKSAPFQMRRSES
jgi:hypothetical protein